MTVSRVINGESNVRDSTRETVMEAVRALNYRPNPAARVLAGARDTRIAIIYSNPSASYLSEMLVGALDGTHRTASQLVLDRWDNLKPAAEKAAAQRLSEGIAGVILPPPLCESKAIAAAFAAEGVPVVALATGRARDDVSCVRIDDFHAAREMTLHLIEQGHSRIAFIKGQPTQTASAQRLAGFEAAMQESSLEVDPSLVVQGFFSYQVGTRSGRKAAGTQAYSDRDLRQQRRHGCRGDLGRAPARARCAERSVGGRIRRHTDRDHRLARTHHHSSADRRDGRGSDQPAASQDPPAEGSACSSGRRPSRAVSARETRFGFAAPQALGFVKNPQRISGAPRPRRPSACYLITLSLRFRDC